MARLLIWLIFAPTTAFLTCSKDGLTCFGESLSISRIFFPIIKSVKSLLIVSTSGNSGILVKLGKSVSSGFGKRTVKKPNRKNKVNRV